MFVWNDIFAAIVGLLVTLIVGLPARWFLKNTVTVDSPERFKEWDHAQSGGGGPTLGLLERTLFFAAFSLQQYILVGGWLAFKVAAKWAAWQHIVRLPEPKDIALLNDHFKFSSRLLGRFLNGTIFNVFCATVGFLCYTVLLKYINLSWLSQNLVCFLIALSVLYAVVLTIQIHQIRKTGS
jgi:hypothetical protein